MKISIVLLLLFAACSSSMEEIKMGTTLLSFPVFEQYAFDVADFDMSERDCRHTMMILQEMYARIRRDPNLRALELRRMSESYVSDIPPGDEGNVPFFRLFRWMKGWIGYVGKEEVDQKMVIIGGGPVGLIHGLLSPAKHVTIIEKRSQWLRDVWFDLYSQPFGKTIEVLTALGLKYQTIEYVSHSELTSMQVITMRCQLLERFLAKLNVIRGVRILQGERYLSMENGRVSTDRNPRGYDVDFIVFADGYQHHQKGEIDHAIVSKPIIRVGEDNITLDQPLYQVTAIVNFERVEEGENQCPDIIEGEWKRHPAYPSFHVEGISNVFKRFYYGHCHMQLLTSVEEGERWLVSEERVKEKIIAIRNLLFKEDKEGMEGIVCEERGETGCNQYDIHVFKVALYQSHPYSGKVGNVPYIIVGDAAMNAHYRLGVGINSAFRMVDEMVSLVKGHTTIEQYHQSVSLVYDKYLDFEQLVMYLETYCKAQVAFDLQQPNLFESVQVYVPKEGVEEYDGPFPPTLPQFQRCAASA